MKKSASLAAGMAAGTVLFDLATRNDVSIIRALFCGVFAFVVFEIIRRAKTNSPKSKS